MDKTILYYICPKCKKEQEVEMNVVTEDKKNYRFTTICSECKQKLAIKIRSRNQIAYKSMLYTYFIKKLFMKNKYQI